MIRFIDLKDQINEGEKEFAFFDTIIAEFLIIGNSQTFNSIDEFLECYKDYEGYPLERFLDLIPKNYGEPKQSLIIINYGNGYTSKPLPTGVIPVDQSMGYDYEKLLKYYKSKDVNDLT